MIFSENNRIRDIRESEARNPQSNPGESYINYRKLFAR